MTGLDLVAGFLLRLYITYSLHLTMETKPLKNMKISKRLKTQPKFHRLKDDNMH